jgi:chromate transporter
MDVADPAAPAVGVRPLALYFLKLGAIGFGGPIALTGAMQRTLVEERRWISPRTFLDGLALAQLAPGPLAAQLAMYIGYTAAGSPGALLIGAAFILPSLLMVWALSAVYVAYGGLGWMQALFHGVGAAVIAIIARSAWRLSRLTLGRDPALWTICVAVAATTAVLEREVVWLFLAAGLVHAGVRSQALAAVVWLPAAASLPLAPAADLSQIFWFFARAGSVVFGSGLAIVPFLYGGVVQEHHWLSDREFLDAVAVAMITPGPVVITVAFIGYLVAGTRGMLAAAAGVFLPVYLFVVIPAPWFRRMTARPRVQAFVEGVTAAAAGAIGGAAIVLARRAWIDEWSIAIGVASLVMLWRWRVPELWIIAAAGLIGLWVGQSESLLPHP